MKKSVIIVEDDRGLREELVRTLDTASDIKCFATYASAEEALPKILEKKPDVVLMDIKLPGMSGIQCVAEIKKVLPDMQIIMVTIYEDSERIFRALKAGASGYLVKSCPPKLLLDSIRDVHNGGSPLSTHIARKVVKHFQVMGSSVRETENLTRREREVLDLLSEGFIYKEIGDKLNIASETVRTHAKSICQKMHVRNRMEAVAKHHSE